jgi:hypothetical protein
MPKAEAIDRIHNYDSKRDRWYVLLGSISMTLAIDAHAGVQFKEMVPRGGLQESRIIKGLARGGTLKVLPAFFSFPHHGVPPKRLTNKLLERLPL